MYRLSFSCLAERGGCSEIVQQLYCLLHPYRRGVIILLCKILTLGRPSERSFQIKNLASEPGVVASPASAEASVQNQKGDSLRLSTFLKPCTRRFGNSEGNRGRQTIRGGGGIKADLSKRAAARVICVYIAAGRFIFYYSRCCINPAENAFQMFL